LFMCLEKSSSRFKSGSSTNLPGANLNVA